MKSNTDDFIEKNIRDEMLVSAYKMVLNRIIGSCIVIYLVAAVMWSQINHQFLISWALLMTILILIGDYNAKAFFRWFNGQEITKNWKVRFILLPAITGITWAVAVFVFYNYGMVEQKIFIITVVILISFIGVIFGCFFLPYYYIYSIPIFSSLTISFILGGTFINIVIAILMVWTLIFLLFFTKKINATVFSELKLRHESHQLSNELKIRTKESEQANIAKSKFLAAASHDLRQPLYALSLFTSVLDEYINTPKVRNIVEQINLSVNALQGLFNALLDISRLDAGVMKDEKMAFDLHSLFIKLANDFEPVAREKGLHIDWPESSYIVYSDPSLLEQILRNYISNAIRYTDMGEVRVFCEKDNGGVNIQVIDSGIGIPEEQQQEIFQEFHQLGNPERDRSKGLGLGLAIVRRTAKLLGHPITLTSEPGHGSTFGITVESSELNENTTEAPVKFNNSEEVDNKDTTIVVIDDEASIREGLQHLLQAWGCEVITASSLDELRTQLREQDKIPNGIIADYRLRDNKTGVEAIRALYAEYNCQIPALIVTGDIDSERLRDVNESGFQVLHKPVAPAKLRAFVRNIQLQQ